MAAKKKSNFFAMLSRMKYINRWGLMRNTINENIAEHSLDTAFIAHALAVISNTYFGGNVDAGKVALIAMYHDSTEIITGDMPTPIKYFAPEIKDAYKNVEHYAGEQLIKTIPAEMQDTYKDIILGEELYPEVYRYVKAADKISAYIKCLEESRMGNKDFAKAEKTTMEIIKELNMPEVDYFVETFLPGYKLTLDEQA